MTGTFKNNPISGLLTIPSSVKSIGDSAFSNCNLSELVIENGVTTIGNQAFRNNKLTSVTIPSTITTLGSVIFEENNSLNSIIVNRSDLSGVTFDNYWNYRGEFGIPVTYAP